MRRRSASDVASCAPDAVNLATPLALQSRDNPVVVDADRRERVDDLPGLFAAAPDRVAAHLSVIGDGVERCLGHRVHDSSGDEVDDVAGVVVGRVFDAGGGPQRSLWRAPAASSRAQRSEARISS
jgi:hypothetical protein